MAPCTFKTTRCEIHMTGSIRGAKSSLSSTGGQATRSSAFETERRIRRCALSAVNACRCRSCRPLMCTLGVFAGCSNDRPDGHGRRAGEGSVCMQGWEAQYKPAREA